MPNEEQPTAEAEAPVGEPTIGEIESGAAADTPANRKTYRIPGEGKRQYAGFVGPVEVVVRVKSDEKTYTTDDPREQVLLEQQWGLQPEGKK